MTTKNLTNSTNSVKGAITKEGPSFNILQSCTDCKYFDPSRNKCVDLDILLNGRLPSENCRFLIKTSINFFTNEISKLKNKNKAKILDIIKEIFPDSYEIEYDETEISFLNEDFDEKDSEKLKTKLHNYSFHIRPNESNSFYICLTKKSEKVV